VEEFRAVLEESVRCRMRATSQPVVLMSGGMDSTSIAALAAREMSTRQGGGPLQTISWVFDELPLADEREFIHPVVESLSLASVEIPGDCEWPLKRRRAGLFPGSPLDDVYRLLRTSAYAAARDLGARVLLAGTYGDNLFYGYDRWLNSLVREGRLVQAFRCLLAELMRASSPGAGLRLLRSRLARLAGWPGRASPLPQWLTPKAAEMARPKGQGAPALGTLRRQARMALDPRVAWGRNVETAYAASAGLELRHPFRDRRLVELSLSLPEHLLHRPPWGKWILREAMAGLLPEITRKRLHESSLHPLAWRGLMERERGACEAILKGPEATWMGFVRKDWLESSLAMSRLGESRGLEALVLWLCISWELWMRRLPEGPRNLGGLAYSDTVEYSGQVRGGTARRNRD
jgi:asparagine synthase (glutamine-hydrolysing)